MFYKIVDLISTIYKLEDFTWKFRFGASLEKWELSSGLHLWWGMAPHTSSPHPAYLLVPCLLCSFTSPASLCWHVSLQQESSNFRDADVRIYTHKWSKDLLRSLFDSCEGQTGNRGFLLLVPRQSCCSSLCISRPSSQLLSYPPPLTESSRLKHLGLGQVRLHIGLKNAWSSNQGMCTSGHVKSFPGVYAHR